MSRVEDPPVAVGLRVCDLNGRYVGSVDKVDPAGFRVTNGPAGSWLRADAVFTVDSERVTLVGNADHLGNYVYEP